MAIKITLEPQEVDQVLADIGKKQIDERIGLWMKIREQAIAQMQAQQAATQAPEAAPAPAEA